MPGVLAELRAVSTVHRDAGEDAGSRAMEPNTRDPSEKELKDYLAQIGDDSGKPIGPFDCTTPERFVPFVSKLFDISKHRIGVFTDHLCRESGDNPLAGIRPHLPYWSATPVIESACKFLQREGTNLDIIVRKRIDSLHANGFEGSEFLKSVIEHPARRGTIAIYVCPPEVGSDVRLVTNCFIVADDSAGYRVEGDTDWLKGVGGLHDEETNKKLFKALTEMMLTLEKAVRKPLHDAKLAAPRPVKFVFDRNSRNIDKPTTITPDVRMKDIKIEDYFFDQETCPAQPTSLFKTGYTLARELLTPIFPR